MRKLKWASFPLGFQKT